MFGEILQDSETHIVRHDVTPLEVEQAPYSRPRLVTSGREDTREVLGITDADRTPVPREGTLSMDKDKIAELRDHYDDTDVAEHVTDATMQTQAADEILVSTSIRLPQSLVNQVREQAAALGVPATALMRQWVIERATSPTTTAVVSVADLQRFIAAQSHSVAS